VPFPCVPWQIQGNNVDFVVQVDSIGDPAKIVSGTTQITRSPTVSASRRWWRSCCETRNHEERILVPGGSGRNCAGIRRISETDDEAGWRERARFVRGGSTKFLVELLQQGLTDYILDARRSISMA